MLLQMLYLGAMELVISSAAIHTWMRGGGGGGGVSTPQVMILLTFALGARRVELVLRLFNSP